MAGFRRKNKAPKIIFDGEKKRSRHYSGSLLSRRGVRGAEAVILAALCAFTTVALSLGPSQKASARTSLPHIEEIKSGIEKGTSSLHILEVVPRKDVLTGSAIDEAADPDADGFNMTGDFGYLVAGQEPVNFDAAVQALTGAAVRAAWANRYLGSLNALGLLADKSGGDGTEAPLTPVYADEKEKGKYYRELYPWDVLPKGLKKKDLTQVKLTTPEAIYADYYTEEAPTPEVPSKARFKADVKSFKVATGGAFEQKITSLTAVKDLKTDADTDFSNVVFWQPEMKQIDTTDSPWNYRGKYVFRIEKDGDAVKSGASLEVANLSNGWDNRYIYEEIESMATTSSAIHMGTEVKTPGSILFQGMKETKADENGKGIWFAAEGDMVKTEEGEESLTAWFEPDGIPKEYTYVGKGNGGNFELTPDPETYSDVPAEDDKDEKQIKIWTPSYFYQGGFRNNNWFLRYVLDYEPSDVGGDATAYAKKLAEAASGIQIDTVSAGALRVYAPKDKGAATGQTVDLGSYDMAILSSGIGLNADGQQEKEKYKVSFGMPEAYLEEGVDLSSNPKVPAGTAAANYPDNAVYEYFRDIFASNTDTENSMRLPVLFDGAILRKALQNTASEETPEVGDGEAKTLSNIAMLENYFIHAVYYDSEKTGDEVLPQAQSWLNQEDNFKSGFAYENIYCFESDEDRTGLASPGFGASFDAAFYKAKNTAFYPVYQEILRENTLRKREGKSGDSLLADRVSEGEVIRYLLNFKNRRPANIKKEIRILDLEPDNHSEITADGTPSGSASDAVLSWFQDVYTAGAIKITTMSTAEFMGKIEDITENYDALYVGGDTTDYKLAADGTTKYNDSAMNGLIYYNVGDTTTSYRETNQYGRSLNNSAGSLENEYNGKDIKSSDQQTNPYRYSGNDVTSSRAIAIKNFADMGYPVIISDRLVKGTENKIVNADDSAIYLWTANAPYWQGDSMYCYMWNNRGEVNAEWPGAPMTRVSEYSGTGNLWRIDCDTSTYSNLVFAVQYGWYVFKTVDVGSGKDVGLAADSVYYLRSRNWSYYNSNYVFYLGRMNAKGSQFEQYLTKPGTEEDVAEYDPTPVEISTKTVDCMTRLYSILDTISAYHNVCSASQARTSEWAEEIFQNANLSQPELTLTKEPLAYSESDKLSHALPEVKDAYGKVSGYKIDFEFQVVNVTDSAPDKSSYTVRLFVDSNSDGLFSDSGEKSEEVDGLEVTLGGSPVDASAVKGGLTKETAPVYHVTRDLPATLQGIVPWKIEVQQNAEAGASAAVAGHDSAQGFSYIHGEPKIIRVLQLNSDRYISKNDSGQLVENPVYDLEWQQQSGDTYKDNEGNGFNGIYGALLSNVKDDFIVVVDTVYPNYDSNAYREEYPFGMEAKNTMAFNTWGGNDSNTDRDSKVETAERKKYEKELEKYNMIVIGFSDSWKDIGKYGALAIKDFADAGKAVLFTHDTGSYNQARNDKQHGKLGAAGEISGYYGYYFAQLLRSTLFMDQYGIADRTGHTYNGTTYQFGGLKRDLSALNSYLTNESGFLAKAQSLNAISDKDRIAALQAAGYSVAWEPKSGAKVTDNHNTTPWVQGFSDYQLERIADSDKIAKLGRTGARMGLVRTHEVSQCNKGQITSYPYNVNTEAFGGPETYKSNPNRMNVSETHFQYYQLNMNADNIVVWYSLAGGDKKVSGVPEYDLLPDDPVNQYYIFTAGNITYSGAGHSNSKPTVPEAKLFVNTMVASFRAVKVKPEGGFYASANATEPISNLVLSGMDTTAAYASEKSDSQKVQDNDTHFASQDPTMQSMGGGETRIYFRIKDANLAANKKTGVYLTLTGAKDGRKVIYSFSSADKNVQPPDTYKTDETSGRYTKGQERTNLKIYKASDNTPVNFDARGNIKEVSLDSGVMYYFVLPDTVQKYIGDYNTRLAQGTASDTDIPTITMVPYTKFSDSNEPSFMEGEYKLTIQAAGLLPIG